MPARCITTGFSKTNGDAIACRINSDVVTRGLGSDVTKLRTSVLLRLFCKLRIL